MNKINKNIEIIIVLYEAIYHTVYRRHIIHPNYYKIKSNIFTKNIIQKTCTVLTVTVAFKQLTKQSKT